MMYVECLSKNNIDEVLKEFAKQYKKCCGNAPAEVTIVGGGSILINYNFRETTQDLDVIVNYPDLQLTP